MAILDELPEEYAPDTGTSPVRKPAPMSSCHRNIPRARAHQRFSPPRSPASVPRIQSTYRDTRVIWMMSP